MVLIKELPISSIVLYLYFSPSKTERVLFHFNGHGVPKPTANGEIWFFNKV